MSLDDIITIDMNNVDLGMYSSNYNTMDTVTISDVTTNTGSVTLTIDPNYQIDLSDSDLGGIGTWYEERRIVDEYNEEKALRENNEGIQKAWEQYKILVELAKLPPEID